MNVSYELQFSETHTTETTFHLNLVILVLHLQYIITKHMKLSSHKMHKDAVTDIIQVPHTKKKCCNEHNLINNPSYQK